MSLILSYLMRRGRRARIHRGSLFAWGVLGAFCPLLLFPFLEDFGGRLLLEFADKINDWVFTQLGWAGALKFGTRLAILQIVGAGFVMGFAFRYYTLRDSSD